MLTYFVQKNDTEIV